MLSEHPSVGQAKDKRLGIRESVNVERKFERLERRSRGPKDAVRMSLYAKQDCAEDHDDDGHEIGSAALECALQPAGSQSFPGLERFDRQMEKMLEQRPAKNIPNSSLSVKVFPAMEVISRRATLLRGSWSSTQPEQDISHNTLSAMSSNDRFTEFGGDVTSAAAVLA